MQRRPLGRSGIEIAPLMFGGMPTKLTGDTWLRYIMVSAISKQGSYAAQQQITSLLRERHRIRPGQATQSVNTSRLVMGSKSKARFNRCLRTTSTWR